MLSMHKLLARAPGRESLLLDLDLTPEERSALVAARTQIRNCLRTAFAAATTKLSDDGIAIIPKFFTQGSWAYGTLNQPTHAPTQQVDMDDGCYLPLNFVKETGKPKGAAKLYFKVADDALSALCEQNRWDYVGSHEHCCRVVLNKKMHVDVPLYAISEVRYAAMKFAEAKSLTVDAMIEQDDTEDIDWTRVDDADVLHATRSGDWQYSDPIKVRDWALGAVEVSGEQLRSIWRYLKTWRDLNYPKGGPSSICLMVMIERGFGYPDPRDDIKLRDVASYVADAILEDVNPPWNAEENLNFLSEEERKTASVRAKHLVATLNASFAKNVSQAANIVSALQQALSVHTPNKPDAIEEVAPYAVGLAVAPSRTDTVKWAPNTTSG